MGEGVDRWDNTLFFPLDENGDHRLGYGCIRVHKYGIPNHYTYHLCTNNRDLDKHIDGFLAEKRPGAFLPTCIPDPEEAFKLIQEFAEIHQLKAFKEKR